MSVLQPMEGVTTRVTTLMDHTSVLVGKDLSYWKIKKDVQVKWLVSVLAAKLNSLSSSCDLVLVSHISIKQCVVNGRNAMAAH